MVLVTIPLSLCSNDPRAVVNRTRSPALASLPYPLVLLGYHLAKLAPALQTTSSVAHFYHVTCPRLLDTNNSSASMFCRTPVINALRHVYASLVPYNTTMPQQNVHWRPQLGYYGWCIHHCFVYMLVRIAKYCFCC